MITYSPKAAEIKRNWHVLDASDFVIGRLATRAAHLLMGKHKTTFVRHMDSGDHVVVLNSEKIHSTGKKEDQKLYSRHSGYPGGFRQTVLSKLRQEKPSRILIHAVSGMLPDNKLKASMLKRFHVVIGSDNPYAKHVN